MYAVVCFGTKPKRILSVLLTRQCFADTNLKKNAHEKPFLTELQRHLVAILSIAHSRMDMAFTVSCPPSKDRAGSSLQPAVPVSGSHEAQFSLYFPRQGQNREIVP